MTNGAIETVFWPGAKQIIGDDLRNSGIYANKPGYHNSRDILKRTHPNDYSIQEPIDHLGPGDLGSAIDISFDSARLHGDYHNIAKWSTVLLEAGKRQDPRAYPLREFQGNTDLDTDVEGWSFFRNHALTSSDKTHLWHIHLSFWRKYINDEAAMLSVLSILNGDSDLPSSQEVATETLSIDGLIKNQRTDGTFVFSSTAGEFISLKNAVYEIGKDLAAIKAALKIP